MFGATDSGISAPPGKYVYRVRGIEAVREADAFDRPLRVAVHLVGQLDAEGLEQRGHDVDGVVVLAANLAGGVDPFRPGDDQRIGCAAAVVAVALPQLERRV